MKKEKEGTVNLSKFTNWLENKIRTADKRSVVWRISKYLFTRSLYSIDFIFSAMLLVTFILFPDITCKYINIIVIAVVITMVLYMLLDIYLGILEKYIIQVGWKEDTEGEYSDYFEALCYAVFINGKFVEATNFIWEEYNPETTEIFSAYSHGKGNTRCPRFDSTTKWTQVFHDSKKGRFIIFCDRPLTIYSPKKKWEKAYKYFKTRTFD